MNDSFFLNVNKPRGPSSREAVDRVVKAVGTKRVGHAGTLDPLASGVLVIAVGKATRLVEYVQRMPKTYEVEFLLGRSSDTDDIEGAVVEQPAVDAPALSALEAALRTQVGEIMQRPPQYSAVKVAGKRAYKLARSGQEVDLSPRPVQIYSIDLVDYSYPSLRLTIRCGSGTYVRSIGRDVGEALSVGAVMSELCRTAIGSFTLESSLPLDDVSSESCLAAAKPLGDAVAQLPRVVVDSAGKRAFGLGQAIRWRDENTPSGEVGVWSDDGEFLGVGSYLAERKSLRAAKGGFG